MTVSLPNERVSVHFFQKNNERVDTLFWQSRVSEFNCPFNEQCNTLYYPMLMARLCITDNRAVQTYAGPTDKKNYARPPYSARAGPVI